MSGNVHGGFPKKISVPEILGKLGPNWAQNRPFQIFIKIGSKDFLDILHMIRGHYCAHSAENRMFSKISVPELWTEKTKKQGIFKASYLKNHRSYRKSDLIFRILSPFSTNVRIIPLQKSDSCRSDKIPRTVAFLLHEMLIAIPACFVPLA